MWDEAEAMTDELQMRGLRPSEDSPDLMVNFFISTRDVVSSTPSTGTSVHWRRGRYGTWGGYSMSMGTPTVTTQTHGTVAVDLVDAERGQLGDGRQHRVAPEVFLRSDQTDSPTPP